MPAARPLAPPPGAPPEPGEAEGGGDGEPVPVAPGNAPAGPAQPSAAEGGGGGEAPPADNAEQAARRRRTRRPLHPEALGPPEEYAFPHVADRGWGKHYPFTTHKPIEKEALLAAVRAAYRAVFPVGHPCAAGPKNAVVAREFGRLRPRRPHNHVGGEFPERHRWKVVREELARTPRLQALLRTLWGALRAGRGLWWGRSAAWLGRARAPAVERTQSAERSHRTPKVRPNVPPAVGGGLQCSACLICFLECTSIPRQS